MGSKGGSSTQPAGQTTSTQVSQPWSAQQPFLQQAFQNAQRLYQGNTPQYFPQSTVAGFNPTQQLGLGLQTAYGLAGNPATDSGTGYISNLLSGGGPAANNPANSFLGGVLGNGGVTANNPANGALGAYTSGAMLNQNPYFQQTANNVLGSVLPSVESTFEGGGRINSPGAAYAASQGATNALAPYAFGNYNQEQQNQLNAASTLGSQYLGGQGAQTTAAGTLGQNYLGGVNAGNTASAISPALDQATQSQINFLKGSGDTQQQQSQAQINDAINRFNFQQQLPYNQLSMFENAIQGNYGGTSTLSQPYFLPQGKGGSGGGKSGGSTAATLGTVAKIAAMAGA